MSDHRLSSIQVDQSHFSNVALAVHDPVQITITDDSILPQRHTLSSVNTTEGRARPLAGAGHTGPRNPPGYGPRHPRVSP